ncbi:branched-chain amino acid ABC transporter permease [Sphaerimonospora mesophila]|uniref:branched-chain amino acid ABC transporter permease n=1 Tax=Sphaerimonospora mesophila TaxID=37483 RepID=UPI0006E1713E
MSSSLASFLQMLFNGLSLGATLALIAVGLTMVFGVLRVVNFSHGVLFMFGAYTTYFVVEVLGQGYFTALVVAAVVVASISAALGATVFRRFEGLLLEGAIAGILLALLLENVALVWFGASPKSVAGPFTDVVAIGGVYLEGHRILIIAVAIVLVTALHLFVTRTRYGRALRAAQQDSFAARSQGIAVPRILIMTFAIGGALAGAAGALVAPQQVLLPSMGQPPLLLAFVIVIVGGMGSVKGSLIAAGAIGLLQSGISTYWVPEAAVWSSFAVALCFLAFRPQGVFGNA